MENKLLSIIIPTLNEEEGIRKTIDEIPSEKLEKMGYNYEVIVVDGDSHDMTRRIAKELDAKVVLEPRPGYGRAYKTGFKHAQGSIIVTLDGDFSYPASIIPYLVEVLEKEKLDFISTNRFTYLKKGAISPLHLIGNHVLTLLLQTIFSIKIHDSQSGMWVFRKNILDKIDHCGNEMNFSEEIKLRCFRNFNTKEIPILYRKRIGKEKIKTFRDGIKNFLHLFKLQMQNRELSR